MEVQPTLEFVQWSQEVNISINIVPTEPVKAYELELFFDPSHLQVNSVEQGDFFQDYQSFYNNGTIDNINGKITKLYALVLGQGDITEEGTILILHCTTTTDIGLSPIVFSESRITNATQYIPLNSVNGAVQVYGEFYPWDCNEDGTCNYLDISVLVFYYGTPVYPGSESADILEDGFINYLDVSLLVNHYHL